MIEIGRRRRNQPAPPRIIIEALADPDRDPARPWLKLLNDEVRPSVLESDGTSSLTWSSLWLARPDAQLSFSARPDASGCGSDLEWWLLVDEPGPDDALIRQLRQRVNELINRDLRASFDQ